MLFIAPIVASAQDPTDAEADARRHFRLGQAHYDSGDFEEAAREFEEAYRLSPRSPLLYNLYVAYREANNLPRAADSLRRYLAATPDAPERDNLVARLRALERSLRSSGSSSTGATTSAGSTSTSGSTSEGGTPEASETPAGPEQTGSTDATGAASEGDLSSSGEGRVDTSTESGGGLPVAGLVVGGIGAALVITGIVTGVMALGAQSDLESMCPDKMCTDPSLEDTADSGSTLALVTDILLVTGVAAVGAGVAMIFLMRGGSTESSRDSSAPSASLGCGPTGCSGAVRVSF